jgi:hypothetical protein
MYPQDMVAKIKRGKTATPRGVILDITSRTFCPAHGESAKAENARIEIIITGPKNKGCPVGYYEKIQGKHPNYYRRLAEVLEQEHRDKGATSPPESPAIYMQGIQEILPIGNCNQDYQSDQLSG